MGCESGAATPSKPVQSPEKGFFFYHYPDKFQLQSGHLYECSLNPDFFQWLINIDWKKRCNTIDREKRFFDEKNCFLGDQKCKKK